MAFPARMFNGYLQIGREATYGSAAAATHRYRVISVTPEPAGEHIESDVMDGTGLLLYRYPGKKTVRFTVELELTHTNFLILWDTLMGTQTFGSAATGVTTGPSGSDYTHVFKHKDILNSLTCQIGMGDPDNAPPTKCERVLGGKILQANFAANFHERVRARLVIEGQDYDTNNTPTSLASPAANDCVLMDSLSAFNDGIGSSGNVLGFELSIDNKTPGRDYAARLIAEPIRQDFPEMMLTIREEFQGRAALDAQLAATAGALTTGAPSLTFTLGAKVLTMAFGSAHLQPVKRDPEGKGRILQSLQWKPISAGSPATLLTVTQVNTQATTSTYT